MLPHGYTTLPPLRSGSGQPSRSAESSQRIAAATRASGSGGGKCNIAATWHAGSGGSAAVRPTDTDSRMPGIKHERLPNLTAVTAHRAADNPGAVTAAPPRMRPGDIVTSHQKLSSRWLAERQESLEWADAVADVELQEKRVRAIVAGTEYEQRHALLWKHQRTLAKLRRHDAAAHSQQQEAERLRYAAAVQLYQDVGLVVSTEAAARITLEQQEDQDRAHVTSLAELEQLQREAERLVEEQIRVEALYDEVDEVRGIQISQMERYYRPPKEDHSAIDRFVHGALVGEPSVQEAQPATTAREPYLMSYEVNDEEFRARQALRYAEMLERLPLEHLHVYQSVIAQQEADARAALYQLHAVGACPSRLSAAIKIQSWWRLSRQQAWSARAHDAVVRGLRRCRDARTAAEWQRRVERMARATDAEVGASDKTNFSEVARLLEAAATRPGRYQAEMDYYLFTLTERVKSFIDCQRHDHFPIKEASTPSASTTSAASFHAGGAAHDDTVAQRAQHDEDAQYLSSRPIIPHRVFFLTSQRRVCHYAHWRRNRWCGGSVRYMHALAATAAAEDEARDGLYTREARDAVGLHAFATALRSHAVPQLNHVVQMLLEDEAADRRLVELEARDADGLLQVTWCDTTAWLESALRPFLRLREEETEERARIEAAQAQVATTDLWEFHWRWARLGQYRQKLANRYTTTRGWRLAVQGGGVGAKFVSLDSAARVLQRFARGVVPRTKSRALREAAAQRRLCLQEARDPQADRQLRAFSQALVRQLAGLHHEVKRARWSEEKARRRAERAKEKETAHMTLEAFAEQKLDAAARAFRAWFDLEAAQPRDLQYKDVLARHHHQYANFYRGLNAFLLLLREGRQRIEDAEAQERANMQHRLCYRRALTHTLSHREQRARMYLEAEEEDRRGQLTSDFAAARAVVAWGVTAKQMNPRPVPLPRKTERQPLPRLTPLERLLSREEVRRTALAREGLRGFTTFLFDFSLPMRRAIEATAAEDLPIVCRNVDCLFDGVTPAVAQLACVRVQEATAREALEAEASAVSYASPMLRGHYMLWKDTLWPRFLLGHLTLSSNGAYMDHRLVALLTQRVGHMGAKLNDLVQLETAARQRITYVEEITRDLRFVYKKLAL